MSEHVGLTLFDCAFQNGLCSADCPHRIDELNCALFGAHPGDQIPYKCERAVKLASKIRATSTCLSGLVEELHD